MCIIGLSVGDGAADTPKGTPMDIDSTDPRIMPRHARARAIRVAAALRALARVAGEPAQVVAEARRLVVRSASH